MKLLIVDRRWFRTQTQVVKQEVADGVRSRDRVQTDHTWIRLFYAISLGFALLVGLRFLGKLAGIDELVAPKTAVARTDWSVRAHDFDEGARFVGSNFGAKLNARNDVLMDESIEDQSCAHRIRRKEQIVT